MRGYNYWLDVAKDAQSRPDLSRLTKGEFGWSLGGMDTLKIFKMEDN